MQMDRDGQFLLHPGYQLVGGIRKQKVSHILDADGIGAHVLQLAGQAYEVIHIMDRAGGV